MQIARQVFAYTRRVEPSSSAAIEMFIGNAVLTIIRSLLITRSTTLTSEVYTLL